MNEQQEHMNEQIKRQIEIIEKQHTDHQEAQRRNKLLEEEKNSMVKSLSEKEQTIKNLNTKLNKKWEKIKMCKSNIRALKYEINNLKCGNYSQSAQEVVDHQTIITDQYYTNDKTSNNGVLEKLKDIINEQELEIKKYSKFVIDLNTSAGAKYEEYETHIRQLVNDLNEQMEFSDVLYRKVGEYEDHIKNLKQDRDLCQQQLLDVKANIEHINDEHVKKISNMVEEINQLKECYASQSFIHRGY